MNVEFLEITLSNYLSYGADTTKVQLNFDKPTLIIGRNYDSVVEGQVDSNGAGKSTILNGLLMCLFDKNLMGIDKNGQINKSNGKNMMLSVTFKIDNIYYKVERYRKHKVAGGDGVRLYINNKEPVFDKEHDQTPDSVANANLEIERIIGIPYEMFIRIVVFSASHEPFLSLPSSHVSKANQRDIIEELFGLTELTHKADKLKETLSASKSEFKNLIEVNDRLLSERQRFDTQLESNIVRASDWDTSRVEKIKNLEEQLGELEAIDLNLSIEGFEEAEKLDKVLVKTIKNVPVLEAELRNVETQAKRSRLWEQEKADTIDSATRKIAELKAIDFEALFKTRAKIQPLVLEETTLKSDLQKLHSIEDADNKEIKRISEAKVKLEREVSQLGDNKCPYCEQDYAEARTKLHNCKVSIEQLDGELQALQDKITELTPLIDAKKSQLNLVTEELAELRQTRIPPNLDTLQKELESYEQKLEAAELSVNPHIPAEDDLTAEDIQESLDAIKVKGGAIRKKIDMAKEFIHPSFKSMADVLNVKTRMNSLKERIDEADSEVNPFRSVIKGLEDIQHEELKTDRINVLDKQIKHEDFLLKLLTKKDSFIRKALLNKNIPLLNNRLRHNLDKVGLPHKVQFTEEMEVKISQFGSDYEYGNFSAGQKARVNLCLAFAFRDVLQSRFGKINLCILDECLDTGLGDVGVKQAAKMVKAIAIENDLSMFIISHRDEVSSMFDRQLEIELKNGFSKILDITP